MLIGVPGEEREKKLDICKHRNWQIEEIQINGANLQLQLVNTWSLSSKIYT